MHESMQLNSQVNSKIWASGKYATYVCFILLDPIKRVYVSIDDKRFACVSVTPFGEPVDPLVYLTKAKREETEWAK